MAEQTRVDVELPVLPVQVHAQYVKDFSFENPNAPDSLRAGAGRPDMDVNIVLDAAKINDESNPDLYESSLKLTVRSLRDGAPLFIAEIVYAALVTVKDIPGPQIKSLLYVDIPQMLFPFARQMLASAVSNGGFPPLLLTPIDFRAMYANSAKKDADGLAA
ncbi:MAG: protein-export chaperone SecB [Micavibrio aeruginosavorus]|uniref:Protein-export chaperone SecB n=1 Tax=Micavibrio aeruginosavorus TaxID=349221 RepID=A0A2W5N6K3_9BACT|nr:MAG: protein-export chaperone SecB [Micavibrio aeruginosavorus]